MQLHVRSTLIIIMTLLIGIMVGIVISGTFFRGFINHNRMPFKDPEHVLGAFERMIDLDEGQREVVRNILMEHFQERHRNALEDMKALEEKLKPVLTPEQMEKLRIRFEKFRKMGPPGGMMFGPGRGGPGEFDPDSLPSRPGE